MKKVFVMLALLIVLFQSFSIPALATIQPWKGNPWKGDSWEGKSWDGSDYQWEGDPWKGNPWEGSTTEGNDWEGNGTEGKGTEGKGTQGQDWEGHEWSSTPWYMDPWHSNGWSMNGFEGKGTTGSPFSGNPFTGTGTNGNPFTGNGTNGNGWNGNPFSNSPFPPYSPIAYEYAGSPEGFEGNPTDVNLPMGFEVAKYLSTDVIGGQVNMIDSYMKFDFENNPNGFKPNGTFFSTLMLNGVKMGLGENTPGIINGISDVHDGAIKTADAIGAAKDFKIIRDFRNATAGGDVVRGAINASNGAEIGLSGLSKVGAISKLNVATAAVGAGYSAFELGFKGAKAFDVLDSNAAGTEKVSAVADAGASAGDLLMNAGVVAAAIPGGQAAGAVMIAGGAVLWGASKLTKAVADNWEGVKKFAKDPIKSTGKAISKGISTVKGWFS
ncbi:hypothetical protein NLX69_22765 [Rossellomorea sp. BNER]|nr:hypothetical protein [Rossellomorea sp. BNER]